jgi:uncharacterized damage-inducible protein DinB
MLRDLVAHKGHANAGFLDVVRRHERAAVDPDVLDLLHHVLIANRFWICAVRRVPFALDREVSPPCSCETLIAAYKKTHDEEADWLAAASEEDCDAILEHSSIPGGRCSVAHALVQVCLHSHGHRAQLAKLLRRYDIVPPQTDFIVWLTHRAEPDWRVAPAVDR